MMRRFAAASLLTIVLACPLQLAAQADDLSANDKDFTEYAGETDLLLVRIARLADMQAVSPKVKAFALTLEKQHAADLKKLTAVANQTGGVAPDTLDDPHLTLVKQLHKLKGSDFDIAFLKMVVNQHESVLESYKREADHGFNPNLQSYAKAASPKLEIHLKEAKELAASVQ